MAAKPRHCWEIIKRRYTVFKFNVYRILLNITYKQRKTNIYIFTDKIRIIGNYEPILDMVVRICTFL